MYMYNLFFITILIFDVCIFFLSVPHIGLTWAIMVHLCLMGLICPIWDLYRLCTLWDPNGLCGFYMGSTWAPYGLTHLEFTWQKHMGPIWAISVQYAYHVIINCSWMLMNYVNWSLLVRKINYIYFLPFAQCFLLWCVIACIYMNKYCVHRLI